MKRLLIALMLLGGIFTVVMVYAQTLKPATPAKKGAGYQYCEFVWTDRWSEYNSPKSGTIYYGNGKTESYNKSLYDGLNYLGAMDWELTTAYIEDNDGSRVYSYTFKRKL